MGEKTGFVARILMGVNVVVVIVVPVCCCCLLLLLFVVVDVCFC